MTASQGPDFTFTHSSWHDGIEPFRFGNVSSIEPNGNPQVAAQTVFDRVLLRAGETVSMKHYIRAKTGNGFGPVAQKSLPTTVVIEHDGDDTKYTLPLSWDVANGIAETSWKIPKNARLGTYSVSLIGPLNVSTGIFQVQEFKVPLMKGSILFPSAAQVAPSSIDAQISVSYQNGGPAKNLPATFAYTLQPRYGIYFTDYDYVAFGNGGVEEKTTRRSAEDSDQNKSREAISTPVTLDSTGSVTVPVRFVHGDLKQPTRLQSSVEFRDANGEVQTIAKNLNLYPANVLTGVRVDNWLSSKKDIDFIIYAVDLKGQPKAGVTASLDLMEEIVFANRERRVGGFYADETVTQIKRANGKFSCAGPSDNKGEIRCRLSKQTPGNYYIVASVNDEAGRLSQANASLHISGRADNYFAAGSDDRIDLVPQKRKYESGDTARLEARFPLQQATVLLTVEREGVIDASVVQWSPSQPFIDLPVKAKYAPNVYVSTFAVRGRVPTGQSARTDGIVDLAKPTFKMGLARIDVSRKAHELQVTVTPGAMVNGEFAPKDKFMPRDEVTADIKVNDANGKPVTGEIALAVVDEGLMELLPNKTWDLLTTMLSSRDLEVNTYTAQMQVIGKRHYGLKAVPLGGDGALSATSGATRDLFHTLVKWAGRVQLDNNGHADLKDTTFELNDSLTKFRIVAIASSGLSRFGKGEATITSNKDYFVQPSLAQDARTGDVFDAEVQARNTTNQSATMTVSGTATITMADGTKQTITLAPQSVTLGAESAQNVILGQVTLPIGARSVTYRFDVANNGKIVDSDVVTQQVNPDVLTRTLQAQLQQVRGSMAPIGVELPQNAVPGEGGVNVKMMDTLTSGLSTIGDHFGVVLFNCTEQKISKAVATNDAKAWTDAMTLLPALVDNNSSLLKFYPDNKSGSDVLTAYVLKVSKLTGFAIPGEIRTKLVSGLKAYAEGSARNEDRPSDPVSNYVSRVNAIASLIHYGEPEVILSSLPRVGRDQLPNATLVQMLTILDHYGKTTERNDLENYLLTSRLVLQGSRMVLSDDRNRDWSYLTSPDTDMADLIQAISGSKSVQWRNKWADDMSKLIEAQVERLQAERGAWDTTIANALGVTAFRTFSKVYEKNPVAGVTKVALDTDQRDVDWTGKPHGDMVTFQWPDHASQVSVNHQGTGAPWALVYASAAVPVTKDEFSGMRISKSVKAVKQAVSDHYSIGDIVEVTLRIKSQAPVGQMAVMDPIPSGAKILGSGLHNSAAEAGPVNWSADWEEFSYDGYRGYFSYIGQDEITVTYRLQLNNSGTFRLPATTVEAFYTPETYALTPNQSWAISP